MLLELSFWFFAESRTWLFVLLCSVYIIQRFIKRSKNRLNHHYDWNQYTPPPFFPSKSMLLSAFFVLFLYCIELWAKWNNQFFLFQDISAFMNKCSMAFLRFIALHHIPQGCQYVPLHWEVVMTHFSLFSYVSWCKSNY